MRPDKKKIRHHDSQKRADMAKAKIEEKGKKETSEVVTEVPPEIPPVDKKYAKLKVVNNWEHYKPLPSDSDGDGDDGETAMTGPDFNVVLEGAVTSDALMRTRAEQEWGNKQSLFTNEFFSLDLGVLDRVVSCIPVHEQLGYDDVNDDCIESFNEDALRNSRNCGVEIQDHGEINSKILAALSLGEDEKESKVNQESDSPKKPTKTPENMAEASGGSKDLEDWLDDFLGD